MRTADGKCEWQVRMACGWLCVGVDGFTWVWMGVVDACGWVWWMGVDGCGGRVWMGVVDGCGWVWMDVDAGGNVMDVYGRA